MVTKIIVEAYIRIYVNIVWYICKLFSPLFHYVCHYFAAFVCDYRLFPREFGTGICTFLCIYYLMFPMRRTTPLSRYASGPSTWKVLVFRCMIVCVLTASLFSRVSKGRKCRDDCYRAIPIQDLPYLRLFPASFGLRKGATKGIPLRRIEIAYTSRSKEALIERSK